MRATRLAISRACIGAGVLVLGFPSSSFADDDVPTRTPSLVWEIAVNCDAGTGPDAATGPIRRCNLAEGDGVVYVHEHTGSLGTTGGYRLAAFDITSGAPRWSHEVGVTAELVVTDESVVLSDKSHIEVYDPKTGALRFARAGRLAEHNQYGVLLMADDSSVTAVDSADGDELWSQPGALGAMCRDYVAVVPARSQPPGPFTLLDHRSGDVRWRSDVSFDPATDDMACAGGPWIYTSDGQTVSEWDVFDGWLDWETTVADAGAIELYREVALVRSGPTSDNVVAIDRDDGVVLWESTVDAVGLPLSLVGRLREGAAGVFTLHPLTGAVVRQLARPADGRADFVVVGASDTRVVIAVDSTVTAYGMNDLGQSWQLDVGGDPDDFAVSDGYLVVRTGDVLRGYGA